MTPEQTYRNPRATKAQLRAALGEALGLPPEPKEEKPPNTFKACLSAFQTAYEKQTGLHYSLAAKDAVAMAAIIKKFHGLGVEDAQVPNAFTVLLAKLPEWYRLNGFSLPVINAKFNEIVASIKQSKNRPNDEYKERIARDLTGQ